MSWQRLLTRKNAVTLIEYTFDPKEGNSRAVYLVRHDSRIWRTALEQNVTIEIDAYGKFKPKVSLADFPQGLSERESMLKLADWLHRLSVSIEDHWGQS